MNDSTEVSRKLAKLNVQKITISWSAGGDDGSVEEVTLEPPMSIDTELDHILQEFAWTIYEEEYGGGTAGEFSAYGQVEIMIKPDGKYHLCTENTYEETNYISGLEVELPGYLEKKTYDGLIRELQ